MYLSNTTGFEREGRQRNYMTQKEVNLASQELKKNVNLDHSHDQNRRLFKPEASSINSGAQHQSLPLVELESVPDIHQGHRAPRKKPSGWLGKGLVPKPSTLETIKENLQGDVLFQEIQE